MATTRRRVEYWQTVLSKRRFSTHSFVHGEQLAYDDVRLQARDAGGGEVDQLGWLASIAQNATAFPARWANRLGF